MKIAVILNGLATSLEIEPHEFLLDVLRRNGCLSVKRGCDTSSCGVCTVLLDGAPVLSCSLFAAKADGHRLDTVEGMQTGSGGVRRVSDGRGGRPMRVLQSGLRPDGAGDEKGTPAADGGSDPALSGRQPLPVLGVSGAIAGDCEVFGRRSERNSIPLMISRLPILIRLIDRKLRNWFNGHRVFNHWIEKRFEQSDQGNSLRPAKEIIYCFSFHQCQSCRVIALGVGSVMTSEVNHPVHKLEGKGLVLGRPAYTDDLAPQNALIVKLLRSPHAFARIKRIATEKAAALPGVACVLTHRDLPRNVHTKAGQGYPEPSPYDRFVLDEYVRYCGDEVAVVAAVSERIAEEALAADRGGVRGPGAGSRLRTGRGARHGHPPGAGSPLPIRNRAGRRKEYRRLVPDAGRGGRRGPQDLRRGGAGAVLYPGAGPRDDGAAHRLLLPGLPRPADRGQLHPDALPFQAGDRGGAEYSQEGYQGDQAAHRRRVRRQTDDARRTLRGRGHAADGQAGQAGLHPQGSLRIDLHPAPHAVRRDVGRGEGRYDQGHRFRRALRHGRLRGACAHGPDGGRFQAAASL